MAETVSGGGEQMQFAEPLVHLLRRLVLKDPVSTDHERQPKDHPDNRRHDDEDESLVPARWNDDRKDCACAGVNRGVHHRRAGVASDESVRGRCGKAKPPGEQVPGDRAEEAGEHDVLVHMLEADHAAADGFGDLGAKEKSGDKVKRGGPQHSESRRQHAGGDDGGDAVGGIVKAVEEVEDKCDQDRDQDKQDVFVHLSRFQIQGFKVAGHRHRFEVSSLQRL
jgi:hypothetical protein